MQSVTSTQAVLAAIFRVFPQSLQANARVVAYSKQRQRLLHILSNTLLNKP
jgi:hypothetical protein